MKQGKRHALLVFHRRYRNRRGLYFFIALFFFAFYVALNSQPASFWERIPWAELRLDFAGRRRHRLLDRVIPVDRQRDSLRPVHRTALQDSVAAVPDRDLVQAHENDAAQSLVSGLPPRPVHRAPNAASCSTTKPAAKRPS